MSGTTLRRALPAAAAAITLAAAVSGAGLAAASTRSAVSGTEHFQLMTTSATSKTSSLVATGVFTAGGTNTDTSNSTGTAKFANGTFVITHSKGTGTQSFNPNTCLFKASLTGTYTLGSGTGAYAGISGSGTYALSIIGVGATSGGTCSKTLAPVAFQQVIRASGPVSLP
jgi:hypothetical protein